MAGVFKANGSEARQRLLEGDLDAMPDLVCDEVDSHVVAAAATEASSTDLQGLAFQELFVGAGGLTSAVRRLDVAAHSPGDLPDPDGGHEGSVLDLLDDKLFRWMKVQIRRGCIRWLHLAPPCKTFTMARRSDRFGKVSQLRSARHPEGF